MILNISNASVTLLASIFISIVRIDLTSTFCTKKKETVTQKLKLHVRMITVFLS